MNAVTAAPARRELTEIDKLKGNLTKRVEDFKQVLPGHITPEKFQRVVATAAIQNPQLLACDRQSMLLAAMKLAQDGLLPDGREAALVPFKSSYKDQQGKWQDKWLVQPMPMVYGLRKKILQSGEVLSIETGVVYLADYESGRFLYEVGLEPPIRYRPNLLLALEHTTDEKIVAAYSLAKIKNETGGDPYWSVEVMRRVEIDKVRQASQTGAVGRVGKFGAMKGKTIEPKGPWVDWYSEMARKTVLRRHAKVLPMSGDILETFERDIEAERSADKAAAESAVAFLSADTSGITLPSREDSPQESRADRLVREFGEAQTFPEMQPLHADWTAGCGEGDFDEGENDAIENAFEQACKRLGIDPRTGEVVKRDSRGMSEVDEETARKLDANDGTLGSDNPTAAEGPADEQRGEDKPSWAHHLEGLQIKLLKASTTAAVEGIERDWLSLVRAAVDDEATVREFEAALAQRKKALSAPAQDTKA